MQPESSLLKSNLKYESGAEPCGLIYISDSNPPSNEPSGVDVGVVVLIILTAVVAASIIGLMAWRFGFARGRDYGRFRTDC